MTLYKVLGAEVNTSNLVELPEDESYIMAGAVYAPPLGQLNIVLLQDYEAWRKEHPAEAEREDAQEEAKKKAEELNGAAVDVK